MNHSMNHAQLMAQEINQTISDNQEIFNVQIQTCLIRKAEMRVQISRLLSAPITLLLPIDRVASFCLVLGLSVLISIACFDSSAYTWASFSFQIRTFSLDLKE